MKSNLSSLAEPRVLLLAALVYFVQGALGLAGIAFPLLLRQLNWSISEIATFSFISGIPWTLKLLYGAISDGFPLAGYRRKPYILCASFLSVISWVGFALSPHATLLIYFLAMLGNLGFALTDVVTDAVIVESSTSETTQLYQSVAWGSRSLGAILGGVAGGWLAQNWPYRAIFGLTAVLPLITLVMGCLLQESKRSFSLRPSEFLSPILKSFRALVQDDLKWFSLLLLVGSFSASFSTPFFFFLKEKLAFSETLLGTLSSLSWGGAIVGCFLYGRLLRGVPIKKTLRWAIWLNAVNVVTTLFVVNRWSAVILFSLGGVLGYLTLLPLMAAAALLAREKGIEGSLFALLMSIHNLGQLLSVFLGGKLFAIIGLGPLILLSSVVGLSGLFFVSRLKTV